MFPHVVLSVRRALAPLLVVIVTGVLVAGSSASAQLATDDLARTALARRDASTLTYATYFGGSGLYENLTSVVTDAEGNVFLTGVTDGQIRVTPGVLQPQRKGGTDSFVAKLDDSGALVWSTYLGGSDDDIINDIAIGEDGSVLVTGTTISADFPTTPGAFQREFRGSTTGCDPHCFGDAFIARLTADGAALGYATYLGGTASEGGTGVAITSTGAAVVVGETLSADFPTTQGAYDTTYNVPTCFDMCEADGFLVELNAAGTSLRRSTYFGGTSWDSPAELALDAAGNVYVGGSTRSADLPTTPSAFQTAKKGKGDLDFNGFVAAFDSELSSARYVTYLGGPSEEHVSGLTVQPDGQAWVTGFGGRGVPTTPNALQRDRRGPHDAFVTGLTSDGSALVYSTRFGGAEEDYGRGIAVDARGRVHVGGSTASDDLRTRDAFQPGNGGFDDLFYLRFNPGAKRPQRASYFGGSKFETATELALGPDGSAYLVGATESRDMPLAGRFVHPDRARNDGVLIRVDDGGLVHAKVDDGGFWQPRMRPHLGKTVKWHFANTNAKANRLVETAAGLFDTKARRPGSDYYFTFPSGRFTVAHMRGNVVQRIAVAPAVLYADQANGIEVRWARFALGDEITFDVEVKVGGDHWVTWLEDTSQTGGLYPGGVGNYRFRVRVQNSAAGMTSPWSPPGLLSEPS